MNVLHPAGCNWCCRGLRVSWVVGGLARLKLRTFVWVGCKSCALLARLANRGHVMSLSAGSNRTQVDKDG